MEGEMEEITVAGRRPSTGALARRASERVAEMDDGLVECIVAPGRMLYSGAPLSDGTCRTAHMPGDTVRVTPAEAAHLRAAGHLLMADGSVAISQATP